MLDPGNPLLGSDGRPAEQVTLTRGHPDLADISQLRPRLDPLGDHLCADMRGETDQRRGQGVPGGIGVDVGDDRLIEFDLDPG